MQCVMRTARPTVCRLALENVTFPVLLDTLWTVTNTASVSNKMLYLYLLTLSSCCSYWYNGPTGDEISVLIPGQLFLFLSCPFTLSLGFLYRCLANKILHRGP